MSTPAGVGSAQGGITASAGFVSVVVANYGDVAIQIAGTFSATVVFEATTDNTNWASLALTPSGGGSDETGATAPGLWSGNCGGYYAVRVRCTSYTSGIIYASLSAAVSTVHAFAPAINATYLTATDETGILTGSRQLTAGANITLDDSTPGVLAIAASGGGGSLPLQVAANGDPVVNNAGGQPVVVVDTNGFSQLRTAAGSEVGFDADGNPQLYNVVADGVVTLTPAQLLSQFPISTSSGGAQASLTTALGVPNADLTWTETTAGQAGNAIQIAYVDPGLPSQSLSATYAAPVLSIHLATDGGSVITTTAADIVALGAYDSAPVTVATAPGSDGSGVVIALSATNLTGGLAALNVTGPSALDNGAITTDGAGGLTAVLQVAADGDPVLRNAESAIVLSVDASGNPLLTARPSGVASGTIGSDVNGVFLGNDAVPIGTFAGLTLRVKEADNDPLASLEMGINDGEAITLTVTGSGNSTSLQIASNAITLFASAGGRFVLNGPTVTSGTANVFIIPTADPHVVGALWNNAGTLTISAG